MGYSLAWVGVHGVAYDEVLQRLSLHPTGEVASYVQSKVSARGIRGDWTLVVAKQFNNRIVSASALAALSVGGEAVACSIEEHVMYTSSEFWSNGSKQWRVEHDAQKAFDHLATSGTLPENFDSVQAKYAALQQDEGGKEAEVDMYFEIPLILAQSLTGFKHDEVSDRDAKFAVLVESSAHQANGLARQWWQFWR